MGKITLEDIAEDSGYSISTVSRALNGSEKISNETKEKVFESAANLEYPTHKLSNGKAAPQFMDIALIVSGFHVGEFYASFYDGFINAVEEKNIILSMVSPRKSGNAFFSFVKKVAENNDGIILYTPELNRRDYLQLKEELPSHYPIVSNGLIENPVFPTISFDGYSGGFLAANHFFNKGYSSCGLIRGPVEKAEARNRSHGFQDFISQHNNMNLNWEFYGDFSFESGLEAFSSFQEAVNKPRAIFSCNDAMCHAFMEAATQAGYIFPDDIAIVGFDDLPICQRHKPTISSISTPYQKLGRSTIKAIIENIGKMVEQESLLSLLPVNLVNRESS